MMLYIIDAQKLRTIIEEIKQINPKSVFSQRTEESSASQYFQFYGYLSQQQNMMQDYVRTSTYQKAILDNSADFHVCLHKFFLFYRNGKEMQFVFLLHCVSE